MLLWFLNCIISCGYKCLFFQDKRQSKRNNTSKLKRKFQNEKWELRNLLTTLTYSLTTSSNGSLPSALKMVGFHSAARAIIAEEQPVACLNTAISSYTFITSLDPPLSNQKDCYEFSKFTIMKIKVWLINFCQKFSTVKSSVNMDSFNKIYQKWKFDCDNICQNLFSLLGNDWYWEWFCDRLDDVVTIRMSRPLFLCPTVDP